MTNFTSLMRQCLLAVALAATAVGAWAAPTSFHVNLNTAALGPDPKYIDFMFSSFGSAVPVTATISNLTGAFGSVFEEAGLGDVNADGTLSISNGVESSLNYVDFEAVFGGQFGFDISFDTAFLTDPGMDGSIFALSVLDVGLNPLGGGVLAQFTLNSLNGVVSLPSEFATISAIAPSAVPEPSSMLLMMTGLGLVGFTARRRKLRVTQAATA